MCSLIATVSAVTWPGAIALVGITAVGAALIYVLLKDMP